MSAAFAALYLLPGLFFAGEKEIWYFSYRIRKVPKETASVPLDRLFREESLTVGSRHVFVRVNRTSHGGTRRSGSNIKCETLRLRAQARKEKMRFLHLPPATRRAGEVALCGFGYYAPSTAVGNQYSLSLSPARRVPRPIRGAVSASDDANLFAERVCGSRRYQYLFRATESEAAPRRLFCNFSPRGEK